MMDFFIYILLEGGAVSSCKYNIWSKRRRGGRSEMIRQERGVVARFETKGPKI